MNNSAYLVNQDGKVAVYRGLQDDLFGMPLSSLDHVTDVDVNKLSPSVASRINDGISVGSMDEANELIASYREDIARQDAATKQSDASASTDKAASSDPSASKTKKSANESE